MSYSTIQIPQNATLVFVDPTQDPIKRFELPEASSCPGRILSLKSLSTHPFEVIPTPSTTPFTLTQENAAITFLSDGKSQWRVLAKSDSPSQLITTPLTQDPSAIQIPPESTVISVDLRTSAKTLQLPSNAQEGRMLFVKEEFGACQGTSTLTLLTQTSTLTLSNSPFTPLLLGSDTSSNWHLLQEGSQVSLPIADVSGSVAIQMADKSCCLVVEPSTVTKTVCLPVASSTLPGDVFCITGDSYNISTLAGNTLDFAPGPSAASGSFLLTSDGAQNWMILSKSAV